MAAPVEARVAAVRTLAMGMTTYQRGFEAALASAHSDINRAQAEFQQATARSRTAFDRATREAQARKAELDRCPENCEGLAHAHARAVVVRDECERRWERHHRALAKVESAAGDLLPAMRAIESSSGQAIPRGRKHIQKYAVILEEYLQRGAQ
jgi:multidrug resistance efflux pump